MTTMCKPLLGISMTSLHGMRRQTRRLSKMGAMQPGRLEARKGHFLDQKDPIGRSSQLLAKTGVRALESLWFFERC